MVTQLVGMKQFRQNMAAYVKKARSGKVRIIVLKKNVPLIEVKAVDEKEFLKEKLKKEIAGAREQVKRGEIYTQEEIMKEFGLL